MTEGLPFIFEVLIQFPVEETISTNSVSLWFVQLYNLPLHVYVVCVYGICACVGVFVYAHTCVLHMHMYTHEWRPGD